MFKRILVPLDGSGRAERSLPIAARMAQASGGTIFLLRVVSTAPASMPSAPGRPLLAQTVGETDRIQAASYLEGVTASELLSGIAIQTHVSVGPVPSSILAYAAEKYADIIVICSHGYTGVTRWWMIGSVAAKVARFAQMPVLVLREGGSLPEARRDGERPLRVLVPLDGSDYAKAALAPAASLAEGLAYPGQGALLLAHVVHSASEARVPLISARAAPNMQGSTNMAKEYLSATMHSLSNDLPDGQLPASTAVTTDSDIAQGIIRLAEDGGDGNNAVNGNNAESFGGCDAIAMTTQGYGGPQLWVGNVTERVLHTTRLPLLIVRPPA